MTLLTDWIKTRRSAKMDQKGTSKSNTPGTAPSALPLSKIKSQNSFFVFGNVYVTNQGDNSNNKKTKSPAFEEEVSKNFNNVNSELNYLTDELKASQRMLIELKYVLEKREKRKQSHAKVETCSVASKFDESVDFFHPNVFQSNVKLIKSRMEQMNNKDIQQPGKKKAATGPQGLAKKFPQNI